MKKWFVLLLLVFMLPASANAVDLYINSEKIATDTPPTIVSGRTLVPLRVIFEKLGATVTWDNATRTATGTKDGTTVIIQIDNPVAYINGQEQALAVPAQIINGRTMVPARFVSEAFNAKVYWDPQSQIVRVTSQLYDVLRVVDGDTIVVNFHGTEEKVRLIGVDTPESVHPDDSKNSDAGKLAAQYTKEHLEGKQVELEFDVQERDQYGRLLAYVYLNGVMYNKTLLQEGVANLATYPPNVKYVEDFTAIVAQRNTLPADFSPTFRPVMDSIFRGNVDIDIWLSTYMYMYVEGTVSSIMYLDGYYVAALETNHGFIALINAYYLTDFYRLETGQTVRVYFVYAGTEDSVATGLYLKAEDPSITPTTNDNSSTGGNSTPSTNENSSANDKPSSGSNSSSGYTGTVYVTRTGKKYHYSSTCNGGRYYAATWDEVRRRGLSPCNKCVH